MARLAGVDIPRDKRVEVALTYIYGVGRTRALATLKETGISGDIRVKDLTDDQLIALRDFIEGTYKVEGDLRREVQADIRRKVEIGSSCSLETTRFLMLRTISTTSSFTPGIVANSCWMLSIRMLVTAAPGIEERRVRRSEFPRVYPKPGSSGSMTNRERNSERDSSDRVGRCAISTGCFLSARASAI